jgi:hypothetical protein
MIGFLTHDVHVNKMVKTKNRYIHLDVGRSAISRHPRFMAIQVTMEVHSMGLDILCTFLKVVDNVSYSGVLDPIYHSSQTFKVGSSNVMQFHHGKEHE